MEKKARPQKPMQQSLNSLPGPQGPLKPHTWTEFEAQRALILLSTAPLSFPTPLRALGQAREKGDAENRA